VARCHAVKVTTTRASIRFPSTGLDLGAGDFTVEIWARKHTDFVGSGHTLFATNTDYWAQAVAIRWFPTQVLCDARGLEPNPTPVVGPAPTDLAWHHFACARQAGTVRLFVDGRLLASGSASHELVARSPSGMGIHYDEPAMPLFIGPMRWSRSARYGADFSPRWHWSVDASTIAQFLVTDGFDGSGFPDEAGRDNNATSTGGVVAADEEAPCK
jgi:hypothetical protein